MSAETYSKKVRCDNREDYYQTKVKRFGQRFPDFHWGSIEVLFNLVYTYDVTANQLARRLGEHGLSLSAFNVLLILNREEERGYALHELSDLLLVSRANITGLIDSLVEKGLAERSEDARDRRLRIAKITAAGEHLLEEVLPGHYRLVKEMLRGIDKEEKATLCKLLTKMRHSAQRALVSRTDECRLIAVSTKRRGLK